MLAKLNVLLLYKDLLSLWVVLRDFPIDGDAEDIYAERDDDYGLADRLRRMVYNKAARQAERLRRTLDGVENVDCEPVHVDILIDLRWRVGHLLSEFKRNSDGVVTSRPWSGGTLPGLDRATLPGFQGTLTSIERVIERQEADDSALWSREITPREFEQSFTPPISRASRQRRFDAGKYRKHPDSTSRLIRVRLRDLPRDVIEKIR